jgi:hypothetical protein
MSWIIQSLLMDKNIIKEQGSVENDELDDLILVERTIKQLVQRHLLSSDDVKVIEEFTGDDSSFPNTSSAQRRSLRKKFNEVCNRIAFYLGGSFTDEGYLDYIQEKHNLTDTQVEKLRNYISSAYKHKLIRKPKSDE